MAYLIRWYTHRTRHIQHETINRVGNGRKRGIGIGIEFNQTDNPIAMLIWFVQGANATIVKGLISTVKLILTSKQKYE